MTRHPAPLFPALGLAAALLLSLGGCQKSSPGQSDAAVPVLGGTASDAMLPLDTATSQPPLDTRATLAARAGPVEAAASEDAADPVGEAAEGAADGAAPAAAPDQ